jgi:hypothetical protein
MADTVKRTAMIGLGTMGLQMARHMVNKGIDVAGYDISPDAANRAKSHGVRICGSTADAGKGAEVVFVMVANDEQIHDVVEGSGLLDVLARGSVIAIASSCSPETCRALAKLAAPKGIGVIDVPLVLGQEAMDNAQVVAYVGGDAASVAKARPVSGLQQDGAPRRRVGRRSDHQDHQQHAALGLYGGELRIALVRQKSRNGHSAPDRGAGPRQRRQLVALALGQEHRQMGREGHGRGARSRAGRQGAEPLAGLVDQLVKNLNQERMKALMS